MLTPVPASNESRGCAAARACALILVFLTLPLLATEWQPVSESRGIGPAAYSQINAYAVSNGEDYLVTWATFDPSRTGAVQYVTTVRSDGTTPDPIAQPLDAPRQAHSPSLTPSRDGYFGSWISGGGVIAGTLDSRGRLMHRTPIAQGTWTQSAWNGSLHLVLYGLNGTLSASILDEDANIRGARIALGDVSGPMTSIGDSRGFLVVCASGSGSTRELRACRISTEGAASGWFVLKAFPAEDVRTVASVSDGVHDVIVWSDPAGIHSFDVDPLTDSPGDVRLVTSVANAFIARFIRSGTTLWISWYGYTTAGFAAPLASDGSAGVPIQISDTGTTSADIASNGATVLHVEPKYNGAIYYSSDIYGRLIKPSLPEFLISRSYIDQNDSSLAVATARVLAVWCEQSGDDSGVYAGRFTSDGAPLDGNGIRISTTGFASNPVAAFNGVDWLIVWNTMAGDRSKMNAVARRLSGDGRLLDASDIPIGLSGYAPRVTSDGSNWLVLWIKPTAIPVHGCYPPGGSNRVAATRISAAGLNLDPDGLLLNPASDTGQSAVDVTWDGSSYVAAWSETCGGYHAPPSINYVATARFSADVGEVAIANLSGASVAGAPAVQASNGVALVAWPAAGSKTAYSFVEASPAPRAARRRSVGTPLSLPMIDGALVAAAALPSGGFMLLTQTRSTTALAPDMLIATAVDARGEGTTAATGTVADDELLMHNAIVSAGRIWIPSSRFDLSDGAHRMWIRMERY